MSVLLETRELLRCELTALLGVTALELVVGVWTQCAFVCRSVNSVCNGVRESKYVLCARENVMRESHVRARMRVHVYESQSAEWSVLLRKRSSCIYAAFMRRQKSALSHWCALSL